MRIVASAAELPEVQEPSGRRFPFRIVKSEGGFPATNVPLTARVLQSTSQRALLEVDGLLIAIDKPVAARNGAQLQVVLRQFDPPTLELLANGRAAPDPVPSSGGRPELQPSPAPTPGPSANLPQGGRPAGADPPATPTAPAPAVAVAVGRDGGSSDPPKAYVLAINTPAANASPSAAVPLPAGVAMAVTVALQGSSAEFQVGERIPLRIEPFIQGSTPSPVQGSTPSPPDQPQSGTESGTSPPAAAVTRQESGQVTIVLRDSQFPLTVEGFTPQRYGMATVLRSSPDPILRLFLASEDALPKAPSQIAQPAASGNAAKTELAAAPSAPGPFRQEDVGRFFVARSLGPVQDGLTMLEIGGRRLAVRVEPPAPEGQQLLLRLERASPQAAFQILDRTGNLERAAAELLRAGLPQGTTLTESLKSLRTALVRTASTREASPSSDLPLRLLSQSKPVTPSPEASLRDFVDQLGMRYEAKLARFAADSDTQAFVRTGETDFKGQLIRLLGHLQTSSEEGTALAIQKHISHLDFLQGNQVLAQAHAAPLRMELPFWMGDQLRPVELRVQADEGGQEAQARGGDRGFRVLMLLDLDHLGQTRIDAYVTKTGLRAELQVENDQATEQLRRRLSVLAERLSEVGFPEAYLRVGPLRETVRTSPSVQPAAKATARPLLSLIDVVA